MISGMISPDPATAPADPHLDAAIARAEEGRTMLVRLARIGMALAEKVDPDAKGADLRAEPKHDPCRGHAAVSRGVPRDGDRNSCPGALSSTERMQLANRPPRRCG
jgi:hypothetical protein